MLGYCFVWKALGDHIGKFWGPMSGDFFSAKMDVSLKNRSLVGNVPRLVICCIVDYLL